MRPLYIMSGNKHKIAEISAILSPLGIQAEMHPSYREVDENGMSFEENATIKALALPAPYDTYTLADDSGIAVSALDGAPGIYSARYAGEKAGDAANRQLLLKNMEGIPKRSAAFICVMALAKNGKLEALFRGECKGEIGSKEEGDGGFGYDPIFVLADGRSMAQLSPEEKNSISHRKQALDKLVQWLSNVD